MRPWIVLCALGLAACSDSTSEVIPDAAVGDGPAACSLLGTYRTFQQSDGTYGFVKFMDSGFFEIDNYHGDSETGPYQVSGMTVTLTDQLSSPPGLGCTAPQTDSWTFSFSGDCQTITFVRVGTVCLSHAAVLNPTNGNGWKLNRQ
jgi:hypothetical protein